MIIAINALEVVKKNIGRTDALVEAMDKIRAYNRLYQMREVANCPIGMASVTQIQDRQLAWIESSCAEHAIINGRKSYNPASSESSTGRCKISKIAG